MPGRSRTTEARGRRRPFLFALPLLAPLLAGCAHAPRAGTGDVAFRLLWEGSSDLDLYVVDPAGECIFLGNPGAASGGVLDVDCNATTERQCGQPIENVYWPPGAAPPGRYRFWARVFNLLPDETPLDFELQLLRGERVSWRHRGRAEERGALVGPFELDWPGLRIPVELRMTEPPRCLTPAP